MANCKFVLENGAVFVCPRPISVSFGFESALENGVDMIFKGACLANYGFDSTLQVAVEDNLVDVLSVLTSIFVYRFVFGVNIFARQQIVPFQETSFMVAEKTVIMAGTTPFPADLGKS